MFFCVFLVCKMAVELAVAPWLSHMYKEGLVFMCKLGDYLAVVNASAFD